MTRRILSLIGLVALMVLLTGVLSAATLAPTPTITLVGDGLPSVMNIGETYTVVVQVESDQQFISASALPDAYYPGRGVVAVQGGDRTGSGTSATLEVSFKAKSPTTKMDGDVAPVAVVVGVRYGGGYVAVQRFDFTVHVP